MARTITNAMSGILQDLELENDTYITTDRIRELAAKYSVNSSPSLIAHRLKQAGWLIATSQQGVWEFAPASYAGAYSKNDPLTGIKSFLLLHPEIQCFLCMQTAAWALGLADRIPSKKEIAFPLMPNKRVPGQMVWYHYTPNVPAVIKKDVPCLSPESVLVHMTSKPTDVRSWSSALEWLPDVIYEIDTANLLRELTGRTAAVKQRTGYLLQNMFPEAANAILGTVEIRSKIRFGPREKALRNDEIWKVSDTILPISPKDMEKIK